MFVRALLFLLIAVFLCAALRENGEQYYLLSRFDALSVCITCCCKQRFIEMFLFLLITKILNDGYLGLCDDEGRDTTRK